MSQPPHYPYSIPQAQQPYGYDPYGQMPGQADDALGPARRAGIMMFVLGGLLLLCGLGCGGMGALAPWDEVLSQQPMMTSEFPEMTADLMRGVVIGLGVAGLVVGVGLILLGYFVRGGGAGAIITALVLTSMLVLVLLLFTLVAAGSGIATAQPQMLMGACVYFAPMLLFALLLIFLIQAAQAIPRVRDAKLRQASYWTYQQQQLAYQQAMYAYQQQQQQQERGNAPPGPAQ